MLWLWLFISGLILVIVLLLIKIHLLRKCLNTFEHFMMKYRDSEK